MDKFKKGDILEGTKREWHEAWHPIVFINGPKEAPLAVILTHGDTEKFCCNIKLANIYDKNDPRDQYFIAHLIEKMSEWGPYEKTGRLEQEDLETIEKHIFEQGPRKYSEYLEYKVNGCPDHKS